MKKRHFSPILLLFLVFLLLQSGVQTTFAASDGALETAVQPGELLIPGGNAFGIKLFTKGVVVIGVTDVQTASGLTAPAADAGLEVGDVIVEIDGHEVNTAEETKGAHRRLRGPFAFRRLRARRRAGQHRAHPAA